MCVKKLIVIATLVFLCLVWYWVSPTRRSVRTFDHLEDSVKAVITASELQAWATNLLAKYPTDASITNATVISPAKLGTNFPAQLLGISPVLGPGVTILHSQDDESNDTSCVIIDWGGGMLGHAGFMVGSTNFSIVSDHKWQEGVYFYPPH